MRSVTWITSAILLTSCLSPVGCGLFRRRTNVSTSVSSNVQVSQTGRDVATLERDQYEVSEISIGENKSTSVFVLTIPVGSQITQDEQADSAYFAAIDRVPGCDAMLMPRVETKRVLIPLLLINFSIRKIRVKGRCIHIKDDDTLAGLEPADGEDSTGTGDGAEQPEATEPPEDAAAG